MGAKLKRKGRKMVRAKKAEVIAGIRKLVKYGDGVAIVLPPEWLEKHELEPGDEVPFVANAIFKIVPVKEVD